MTNIPYPKITDDYLLPLRAVESLLIQHKDLLDRPECPYPHSVKKLLTKLFIQPVEGALPEEYSEDDLLAEITSLYQDLKGQVLSADAKDNIAMLKTRADLLTKLVTLKERAMNTRDMARFQKLVVEVLETICTNAQRNEFLELLKDHV